MIDLLSTICISMNRIKLTFSVFYLCLCLCFPLFGENEQGGDDGGLTNQTVPSPVDSDGDGLSDHDETYIWGTSNDVSDSDGDGVPDGRDSDGDGVEDGEDMLAHLTSVAHPRVPHPSYAIIDLGTRPNSNGSPMTLQGVNNNGTLFYNIGPGNDVAEIARKKLFKTIERYTAPSAVPDFNSFPGYSDIEWQFKYYKPVRTFFYNNADDLVYTISVADGSGSNYVESNIPYLWKGDATSATKLSIGQVPDLSYESSLEIIYAYPYSYEVRPRFLSDSREIVHFEHYNVHYGAFASFDYGFPPEGSPADGSLDVSYTKQTRWSSQSGQEISYFEINQLSERTSVSVYHVSSGESDEYYADYTMLTDSLAEAPRSNANATFDISMWVCESLNNVNVVESFRELKNVDNSANFNNQYYQESYQGIFAYMIHDHDDDPELLRRVSVNGHTFTQSPVVEALFTAEQITGTTPWIASGADNLLVFQNRASPSAEPILYEPTTSPTLGEALTIRDINDLGQVIVRKGSLSLEGQLWQNGRVYEDEEILGENSDWSKLDLYDLSDNGDFMVGTAVKNGQEKDVLLLKMDIVPDYDRSGVIDQEDYQKAAGDDPFYFWINNDRDSYAGQHDSYNQDTPSDAAVSKDSDNLVVDGVRDLEDFFPIYVDFHGLLDNMDVSKVQIELLGAEVGWLNLPEEYVGMNRDSATFYLKNVSKAEEWANQSNSVTKAGEGVYFTQKMVERIRDDRGIVLLEGHKADDEPLKLRFSYDGTELFTYEMELKLSNVEDMYRHINLMSNLGQSGGVPTNTAEPSGFPDSENSDKHFVFVHGYNVNTEQARGWNAETFKRLYWAGSRAKFTGVTWWGFRSQAFYVNSYKAPYYYENVINAHRTGFNLVSAMSGYTGDITIAAHSMGNIVASSSIVDHGLRYDRYFLLNAAVAVEAYDSSTLADSVNFPNMAQNMINDDFENYESRLYASNWHNLFTDTRNDLTWKDRYGVISNAYNFFSSGEEVLENGDGTAPPFWDGLWKGFRTWNSQEWNKGSSLIGVITDNRAGGWSFNEHWMYEDYNGDLTEILTPTEAAALTDEELRLNPFFYSFQSTDSDYGSYNGDNLYGLDGDTTASNQAGLYLTRAKLLAEAIPALSYATGRNDVEAFDQPGGSRNIDINAGGLRNGWPSNRGDSDWKHSDMKNIPYTYVYPFYEELVETGGLNVE